MRFGSGGLRGRSGCSRCLSGTASLRSMARSSGTATSRISSRSPGRTLLRPSSTFTSWAVAPLTWCASCASGWTPPWGTRSRALRGSSSCRTAAGSGILWTCCSRKCWGTSRRGYTAHGRWAAPVGPRHSPATKSWLRPDFQALRPLRRQPQSWAPGRPRPRRISPSHQGPVQHQSRSPGSPSLTARPKTVTWPYQHPTTCDSGRTHLSNRTPVVGVSSLRWPGTTLSPASVCSTVPGGTA
mmetsp:Transcript_18987/g.60265  ORF Transcript_18987/g.60265 Transcript_18987/m.60265 type:complete len:241 (+) Transcript_18987:673-1395(+)